MFHKIHSDFYYYKISICRVIGGRTIHLISKLKYWSGHRCPRGIRWLSSLGSLGCGRRCQWGCNCCCRTRWPLLQPQMLNLQHGSLQLSLKIPAFWVLLETGFASRRWNQHVKKSNRHVGNMVSYTISSLKLCLSKRYIMPQKRHSWATGVFFGAALLFTDEKRWVWSFHIVFGMKHRDGILCATLCNVDVESI